MIRPNISFHKMPAALLAMAFGVAVALVQPALGGTGPAPRVIPLGDLPLLFADESGIVSRTGVVRTLHPARTRSAPVLEADRPWEGNRVYVYGSIYFDPGTGRFQLWYISRRYGEVGGKATVPGLREGKGDLVLYAASKDGAHWIKPSLGLFSFEGSRDNNIIFDLHSPSVFRDDAEPDPALRYKMLGTCMDSYYSACSPDGLHWTGSPQPIFNGGDMVTFCRDPLSGDYLAYHKQPAKIRGFDRRVIWLSRSRDFKTWTKPELVFAPDEEDDAWADQPGQRTEVYNMSVFPHAAGFIGLPTIFRVTKELSKEGLAGGQSSQDGPIDVQLATSLDGVNWRRSEPRLNMIPRGAHGNFDAGAILGLSSTTVDAGDETWVYYTAITTGHGAPIPPKRLSIGRAGWRRHGFTSLDAGAKTGRIETVPVLLARPSLVINADASRGQLRVALLEAGGQAIPGFSASECQPLHTDDTRWTPHWNKGLPPPADRPLRIVVEFTNSSLFSLESPASSPKE